MILNRLQMAIAGAVVLALLGYIAKIKIDKSQMESSYESYQRMMQDSIRYTTNIYGEVVAQRDAAVMETKALASNKELLEELNFTTQKLGKRLQNLESYTKTMAEVRQTVVGRVKDSTIIVQRSENVYDTLKVDRISYEDEWTLLEGYTLADSFDLDIEVRVPMKIVVSGGRWKLFGKERTWLPRTFKRLDVEAMSENPNVNITELQVIKAKD